MDKNAIKKYAVWARRELISRVSQKAQQFGITEKEIADANADTVCGRLLSTEEKTQRQALIAQIKREGFEQVMEEVAYTWFNRFSALRFMEVNGYLPSHVRVFTDDENNFKPQILAEAIHLELDGLDMDKVYALKEKNDDEALFKYLLITQCNALSTILPGMFQRISDYTELLFPDNLLRSGSVLEQMISLIPEEDWKDQVQIIGWLYQYYNTEPKDKVFADLKKNIKITKENIPAATQLFTPDWIVRYMVENSLGRLWIERNNAQNDHDIGHWEDNNLLKSNWKYYLEEAQQEPEVQAQLDKIREEYKALKPEEIKCIDPCMGSGHILVYMFDVLMQIYVSCGYSDRDAVKSIIENNLYGLDIDDRAAQLAYFSVMMKARQYDARFFSRKLQPHVYAICESNTANRAQLKYFGVGLSELEKNNAANQATCLLDTFKDAKEYGSILNVEPCDWVLLRRYVAETSVEGQVSLDSMELDSAQEQLNILIDHGEILAQKYDVVVTNPPYMGSSGMGAKLSEYVKKNYPDSKSDLFAVFIERCGQMTAQNCYQAMITQHAWMFLSSFEKLRAKLLLTDTVNMAHLGARAFEEIGGEVVQTTGWVQRKSHLADYKGTYARLVDYGSQQEKENAFLAHSDLHTTQQENFSKIPGSPIAYWVSERIFCVFESSPPLNSICKIKNGMSTTDNNKFLRHWYECQINNIGFSCENAEIAKRTKRKWFPYNKGGEFRKYYGNIDLVVNWFNDGQEIKKAAEGASGGRIVSQEYYFMRSISWSKVTAGQFVLRFFPQGFLFDVAGPSIFADYSTQKYILGFMNSKVKFRFLDELYPTINYEMGQVSATPIILSNGKKDSIESLVGSNITLSKSDWDSFETSWDFKRHPLI